MPTRPEPINAIAYAQFHLRGGLKGLLLIMLGTSLLIALMAVVMFTSNPRRVQQAAEGAVQSLLGIQWMVLTLFGGSRVAAAVRADQANGLIESHRLTPTPPLNAVTGYVFAAPLQAIAVALVILPCGVTAAVIAQVPVSVWLVGNLMAFGAAVLVWSLAALTTFTTRQAGAAVAIAAVAGSMAAVLIVVPAIMVLASPIAGQNLWMLRRTTVFAPAYFFTLTADGLLSGVCFLAAARRYRSVVTDAFDIPLGLLLLTIWAAITIIGLTMNDVFWDRSMGRMSDPAVFVLAGIGSSMLVALLPVAAIARYAVMPCDAVRPNDRSVRMRVALIGLPLCIALAWSPAAVVLTVDASYLAERLWGTAAIVAITLLAAASWFAAADLRGRTGWVPTIVWATLTNVAPLIFAAVVRGDATHVPLPPSIATTSPAAALALLWNDDRNLPHIPRGIVVQATLLIIPLSFFLLRLMRGRPNDRQAEIDNTATANAE